MAVTNAKVSHPNQQETAFPVGMFKGVIRQITFDSSYPTTGEVVTAASLGFQKIDFSFVEGGSFAHNAAGTASVGVKVVPNAARTQVTLFLYRYDGASAGKASFEEAANAFDASTFSTRIMFLGS
jgi:hypothetical protein